MQFAFTEDQLAITQAAREMLVETCQPADLRRMLAAQAARDAARWQTIVDMGLLGLLAPDEAAGMGLAPVDLVGIAEAAGYVGLPEPLVETAGIGVPLLAALGDASRLAAAIAGESVAIGYPGRRFVADADTAGTLLLADGDALHLVDAKDVGLTRQESIDPFRRLFRVDWTPTEATRQTIGWGDTADRGAVMTAAQLIGIGQRAIDLAVAYAKERNQFGKPIGSYQAIKHLIATAQVAVEFARPVVYAAAAELPLDSVASRARISHAKIVAGEAADLATRTAVQVHGAMGITWEIDVHFFLKRALALRADWGTTAFHTARVLERIMTLPTGPDLTFSSDVARAA
ncbi:acyl-CoA dehydrogenase family protein [Sphingomonas sp. BIUV-7]|uniref:Acyl-CoA dehydrogenase family protein n=1 Tax=Sphingomonas natans TaxID=3063330 RepID=A0ABT8Y8C5_9SPHN|nr:acyl-CoA dehydrogenase family protein [Sphingomonas sp. BIUV-7]MDO6414581.1 acyl-CoA dehydrogenase family protein [Sphingomonas sp. BIUV-7]